MSVSQETVRRRLNENQLKPWKQKMWCIGELNAEYVACMEDVLDLYSEPPDPSRPVVCFDETPVQLIEETRTPIAAEPGKPVRHDYEYRRNGVANLFLDYEIHTGHPPPQVLSAQNLSGLQTVLGLGHLDRTDFSRHLIAACRGLEEERPSLRRWSEHRIADLEHEMIPADPTVLGDVEPYIHLLAATAGATDTQEPYRENLLRQIREMAVGCLSLCASAVAQILHPEPNDPVRATANIMLPSPGYLPEILPPGHEICGSAGYRRAAALWDGLNSNGQIHQTLILVADIENRYEGFWVPDVLEHYRRCNSEGPTRFLGQGRLPVAANHGH